MAMMQLRSCSPVKLHFCDCAPSVRPGVCCPRRRSGAAAQAHSARSSPRPSRPQALPLHAPTPQGQLSRCPPGTPAPRPPPRRRRRRPASHHDIAARNPALRHRTPPCPAVVLWVPASTRALRLLGVAGDPVIPKSRIDLHACDARLYGFSRCRRRPSSVVARHLPIRWILNGHRRYMHVH